MKKTVSLILAVLLLASSMTACGNTPPMETTEETKYPVETTAPATEPVAADVPAPEYSYDTTLLVENCAALAHIVVSESAGELEQYAAEELRYHIEKVSGAEMTVTNAVQDNSLPIIICTPATLPELETMFPDDIDWLTTLEEEDGRRWGSDGFAIRTHEGKIYIFGATERGAINGVYDFIEENLGVLWVRTDAEYGLVYDEMLTVNVVKTDYREKSPFEVRGWNLCGNNGDYLTEHLTMRNKLNTIAFPIPTGDTDAKYAVSLGMTRLWVAHNLKNRVLESPLYDPDCTEYWNTDDEGNPLPIEESVQINFFSDKAAEAVAAALIKQIKDSGVPNAFVGIEDYNGTGRVAPNDTQPFEYEPGKFAHPLDTNYDSTVYFTFINKVARLVKEECPEGIVDTFAYFFTMTPPACKLEENVRIVYAPLTGEDMAADIDDPDNIYNRAMAEALTGWKEITSNVVTYNYYGCCYVSESYERPIWDKIQGDLQYFADKGFSGLLPEGLADSAGKSPTWGMNALTFWIYHKLSWNPYEDVDALIEYFCDKCYGDASPYMQEYYRLIKQGWVEGKNDYFMWGYTPKDLYLYMDNFVSFLDLEDDIIAALQNAWYEADEYGKARIRHIKETYENYFSE